MKQSFLFLPIVALGLASACISCNKQPSPSNTESIDSVSTSVEIVEDSIPQRDELIGYVQCVDTLVDSCAIRIYTPYYQSIHLYCGEDIPDGSYANQIYCAAAAFTGAGYDEGFRHDLVAGDHVSEGRRFKGYRCKRNSGAFVAYQGTYKFLLNNYSSELDEAAKHNGMGFAQEMMIHQGVTVKTTRSLSNENIFRALCERNGDVCVIESAEVISFGSFIDCLLAVGATEALYLDMGGWSYSWYSDKNGNIIRPFPYGKEVLTNAIVFEGCN